MELFSVNFLFKYWEKRKMNEEDLDVKDAIRSGFTWGSVVMRW